MVFLCEGGTAKTFGILAAEILSHNQQCDCFVTKRQANQELALKEVTNWWRRLRTFATVFMGKRGRTADPKPVNVKESEEGKLQKGVQTARENYYRRVRLRAFEPAYLGSFWSFRNSVTVKSRVIASVMGQKTPNNQRIQFGTA